MNYPSDMYFGKIQCLIFVVYINTDAFLRLLLIRHLVSFFDWHHFGAQRRKEFGYVDKNKRSKACSVLLPPVCEIPHKNIVNMLVVTGPNDLFVDLFLELLLVIH